MQGEENAEDKIKALDEMHQKYKFMESSLDTRYDYLPSYMSLLCISIFATFWLYILPNLPPW